MAYSRYTNIPEKKDSYNTRVVRSTIYPPIERHDNDLYVITVVGDTLYALAEKYYSSVNYYWIIGEANEKVSKKTQNIPPGLQLRIPNQLEKILRDYDDINQQAI
tara:strand:+ start:693 stop:1007 length:315 start_codon:yes stop_codon:yes gene_type:complete